jgi:hypothetical protein
MYKVMARVKYSAVVSSIDGSIGSACFQSGLYGNILRQRPSSKANSTPSQLLKHTYISQVQAAWQSLTNEQRRQWEQYIAFNNSHIRRDRAVLTTGYAFYLRYNVARLLAGYAIKSDIAYANNTSWPNLIRFYVSSGENIAQFDTNWINTNIACLLFVSRPQRESRIYSPGACRFVKATYQGYGYYYFTLKMEEVFGKRLVAGDFISFRLYWISVTAPLISAVQTGTFLCT